VPQGSDSGLRGPLSAGVGTGPADCRACQLVPGEYQHQAAGARGAPVYGQARNIARARFLREPVRILPGRQRVSADRQGRQRQAQAQREVSLITNILYTYRYLPRSMGTRRNAKYLIYFKASCPR